MKLHIDTEVEVLPERTLVFRMSVGEGVCLGIPVEYSLAMGSGDPMIKIGEQYFRVDIESIIRQLTAYMREKH